MKKVVTLLLSISGVLVGLAIVFFIYSNKMQADRDSYIIGIVNPNPATKDMTRGFIEGLAEYGYIQGRNLTYIKCESKKEMDTALKDMVDRPVDLIFAVTTPATQKAKKMSTEKNIPVVFIIHDPINSGIINSLSRPGSNITGIQVRGSTSKALEWLLTVAPGIKHLFVPVKFDTKASQQNLDDLQEATRQLGIRLTVSEVKTGEELATALSSIPEDVDGIFFVRSIFISANINKVIATAITRKLPIGAGSAKYKNGAMVSYGLDRFQSGKQASRLAHMILQRISPADIPAEISNFYLGINLKTAHATGIKIPNDILTQADYIIIR